MRKSRRKLKNTLKHVIRGAVMSLFKNLYNYRELLKSNVKKEIRGKYKGSFLGVLWSFINPLLQVAVYAIVFPFNCWDHTMDLVYDFNESRHDNNKN